MPGMKGVPDKQRRAQRRRNHVARDLYTPKYGPRIKPSKRQHLIDEQIERELDYDILKELGLTSKE